MTQKQFNCNSTRGCCEGTSARQLRQRSINPPTSWVFYCYQHELLLKVEFNLWSDSDAIQEWQWGTRPPHMRFLLLAEEVQASGLVRVNRERCGDIRGIAVIHYFIFTHCQTLLAQTLRWFTDVWHFWATHSSMNWCSAVRKQSAFVCSVHAHGEGIKLGYNAEKLQLFYRNLLVSSQENVTLTLQWVTQGFWRRVRVQVFLMEVFDIFQNLLAERWSRHTHCI